MKENKEYKDIDLIDYRSVIFFESDDDDVYCTTTNGKFLIKEKLYNLLDKYSDKGILRIHNSYVVNVSKIKDISPQLNSTIKLILINNEVVYVSRTYLKSFKNYLKKGVVING